MAAAVLLLIHAAFVVIPAVLVTTTRSQMVQCPASCSCLGSMVDCSKRGLLEVPADLPQWATILELQSNTITSIPDTAFRNLNRLEELDLSGNQLQSLNASIFQQMPALKELKLAYNDFSEIPMIGHRTNITQLILHHNKIHTIRPENLENLSKLRLLDLNFNRVMEITPGSFPDMPSLHQLFLNSNRMSVIEAGAFDNITSLEWIKLNKNRLSHLPKDLFRNLNKLKYLELNRNRVSKIEGLTFKELGKLLILKLRHNQISVMEDGAFYSLKSLQNLQLDFNNISAVKKGWLFGLEALEQLSLSYNQISFIDPDGWEYCGKLWKLDLTHNLISAIGSKNFSKLANLKHLYLDHNHISSIGEGAFSNMNMLQILEMNNNEISWTIEDMNGAFKGLQALSRLSLDSNRIKSIAKRAFNGLDRLKQLHLTDNAISFIESNAFATLPELQELWLNSTSLLCDCQLQWFPGWLKKSGFQSNINAVCSHPDWLVGKSIFDVDVNSFRCEDIPKPVIIVQPGSGIALKGNNATLNCTAASSDHSPMHFQWKKDNKLVTEGEVEIRASTSDGKIKKVTTVLHIRDVEDEDGGRYQCIVSNALGTSYSDKAKVSVHIFPSFTKVPVDFTLKAGTAARLECAATGQPSPIIAWQKDGGDDFPAARERRMHVMPSDDVFFIVDVKSSDEGVYSCTAKNAAGTIMANASLTVLETPSFVKPMEDKTTQEGETAVLECMASGSPKPKLRWMKDNHELDVTDRHFFTADNQLLIIVQTKPADSGTYSCEMKNTLGADRDTSTLRVIALTGPQKGVVGAHLNDESTTTGIIIIAVVCCVVGTSLVWVIIIYQTRRKNEEYSSTPTDETTLPGETPSTPYHSSDKGVGTPANTLPAVTTSSSFAVYQNGDVSGSAGTESSLSNDCSVLSNGRVRTAAIFPSDVDDAGHQPTVQFSGSSIRAVNDTDSEETEDSGSSNSDSLFASETLYRPRSYGSGCLQTFHPHPTNHDTIVSVSDGGVGGQNTTCSMVKVPHPHKHRSTSGSHTQLSCDQHHGTRPPGYGDSNLDNLSCATFPRCYTSSVHNKSNSSLSSKSRGCKGSQTSVDSNQNRRKSAPHGHHAPSSSSSVHHSSPVQTHHSHHQPHKHISLGSQNEAEDNMLMRSTIIPDCPSETSYSNLPMPNRTFQV